MAPAMVAPAMAAPVTLARADTVLAKPLFSSRPLARARVFSARRLSA